MQIVLAKIIDEMAAPGRFQDKPVAMMWLSDGTGSDIAAANEYAKREGYTVYTFTADVSEPLEHAKAWVMAAKLDGP